MKRIFIFALVSVVLCSSVFALEPGEVPEGYLTSDELPSDAVMSGYTVGPSSLPSSADDVNNFEDWEITDISTFSVSPVEPSDTTGLKQVLLTFLGSYDPVIVEYEYKNQNNSYYSYLREVQPDYVWMASFILLCLFVYCLFRLGGALIG